MGVPWPNHQLWSNDSGWNVSLCFDNFINTKCTFSAALLVFVSGKANIFTLLQAFIFLCLLCLALGVGQDVRGRVQMWCMFY